MTGNPFMKLKGTNIKAPLIRLIIKISSFDHKKSLGY